MLNDELNVYIVFLYGKRSFSFGMFEVNEFINKIVVCKVIMIMKLIITVFNAHINVEHAQI